MLLLLISSVWNLIHLISYFEIKIILLLRLNGFDKCWICYKLNDEMAIVMIWIFPNLNKYNTYENGGKNGFLNYCYLFAYFSFNFVISKNCMLISLLWLICYWLFPYVVSIVFYTFKFYNAFKESGYDN